MEEYQAALEALRKAGDIFRPIQASYRARLIGDTEYLAARAEYMKAHAVLDAAETKLD